MCLEKCLSSLPFRIQRYEEETCPLCGNVHSILRNYELEIKVSEFDILHDYVTGKTARAKHFHIYYRSGNKYIGDPTGLGEISFEKAINNLKKEPIVKENRYEVLR